MRNRRMQELFEAVEKNKYGFYELKGQYRKKLDEFYEATYFQSNKSLYKKQGYSDEELTHKENLLREKEYIYAKLTGIGRRESFLDIGCGEGYALNFFYRNGWTVCGIDFSDYGIKAHNPNMEKFLIKNDLMAAIQGISKHYDFINMDNVLEHLPDSAGFLGLLRNICSEDTIVCIRVPNDFSVTQMTLYKNGYINGAFFVTKDTSEHFNYFTLDNLTKFVESNGFEVITKTASYPIDFNLFNPRTNYVAQPEVGHDGHIARLKIENMLFETSLENTIKLHQAYAECGVGRDISVYMKLKR